MNPTLKRVLRDDRTTSALCQGILIVCFNVSDINVGNILDPYCSGKYNTYTKGVDHMGKNGLGRDEITSMVTDLADIFLYIKSTVDNNATLKRLVYGLIYKLAEAEHYTTDLDTNPDYFVDEYDDADEEYWDEDWPIE